MLNVQQESSKFHDLMNCFEDAYMNEETRFKTRSLSLLGRACNVHIQFECYIDEHPKLVGYFDTGKANDGIYATSALTALDIENCDVRPYMNGYDIIDFEGMLRTYPEMFYA